MLDILRRMIDSFGDSWSAVVITLDLDRMMSGQAEAASYGMALVSISTAVLLGYAAYKALGRGMRIRRETLYLADQHAQAVMERRVLKQLLRDTREGRQEGHLRTPENHTPIKDLGIPTDRGQKLRRDTLEGEVNHLSPTPPQPIPKEVSPLMADPSLGDVAQWAEDTVERSAKATIQSTPLHDEYCTWCAVRGKKPVNRYGFGLAMKELGWVKKKTAGLIQYQDIAVKKKGQHLRIVD